MQKQIRGLSQEGDQKMEEAKEKKAVLITSAFHMPRSVKTFDKGEEGLIFYPAPCDFMAKSETENFFDYIRRFSF